MGEEVLGGNVNERNTFSETTETLKQKRKDLFFFYNFKVKQVGKAKPKRKWGQDKTVA